MISIRQSVDDLERLEILKKNNESSSLLAVIRDCYALAIDSAAHYAVEIDPGLALGFASHLKSIEEQIRKAQSVDQLRAAQSSFRGELREHRDKAAEQLKKLRRQIEDTTAAMIAFADTVACNGVNHEQAVHNQLRGLESITKKSDINEIRVGIGAALVGIESSVHEIQRSNQLVIAQLQDEIRALHIQTELERKALYTDRASGAWNRQKIDTHIENLLRQNQPFCLLLVCLRNLKRLEDQYPRAVVESTLKVLTVRFSAVAGDDVFVGRWSENQFVAVLDVPLGAAIPLSAEASRKLSESYSIQDNGLAQKINLHATAGVIDRPPGADAATFYLKLHQFAGAIAGA